MSEDPQLMGLLEKWETTIFDPAGWTAAHRSAASELRGALGLPARHAFRPDVIYFCGVQPGTKAGHYCSPSQPEPRTPWAESAMWGYALLDWHPERDGERATGSRAHMLSRRPETEGEFAHLVVGGWTLIAAWDRSADRRGGCSASFALDCELTGEDALKYARERFPRVFARIEAHIGKPVIVRPAVVAVPR